jgi:sterol 14alpha-demethylase
MVSHPTPPALPGFPLLGNALDFRRDPIDVVRRGYERFGRVFSIRLGPKPIAVILGPANNKFFFTQTDTMLSMREVYKFVIPMFGEVLQAAEPPEYKEQRTVMLPAFHREALDSYVERMVHETLAWLEALGDEGEFDLWSSFEQLSMHIAASTLMGCDFRQRMGPAFWALYRDLAGGMEFVLPTNLPLPRFRRRDRAKIELRAMLGPIIADRRTRSSSQNDFLQTLVEATYSDGRSLTEDMIIGMILSLIFAAYDTTAAQASWSLVQLIQHPHWQAVVLDELQAVLRGGASHTNVHSVHQLTRLEWALKETVRMRPITTMLWRHTAVPYDLDGYHIPRGWITMICPPVSHRLPDVFSNPDLYDPERFSPERAEDRSDPFTLVNFGGGVHRCLGVRFAFNEMKVILALLLQSYALELVNPAPRPDYSTGITRPESPCCVRYRRRVYQ